MGDAEKESMKKDIAIAKAVDLIMDNIKERAKAKRKTDAAKEESAERIRFLHTMELDGLAQKQFLGRSLKLL